VIIIVIVIESAFRLSVDLCVWMFEWIRDSMDGGRAQAVFGWIAESRERWLERNLKKLCQNSNADAGCKPCSEVLSPPK
jgi:hypothetical protein